ncbi:MAG: LPS-assembly protein LptD [Paludibacteraceae bacterium]|nr:LPS-assembly protein LptD [Paludibacteraceae bacterium]
MTILFLLCLSAVWAEDSIPGIQSTDRFTDRIQTDSLASDSLTLDSLAADTLVADSLAVDSLAVDSLAQDSLPPAEPKKSDLKAPVYYQSADSMVMTKNGTAYLHGKGELKYETMELTSEYIRMNLDSSLVYAQGVYDSLNYEWIGKPVFKDGKDSYETNEMTYNIRTQKGYIRHVVTQQGEGYVIADKTKKRNDNVMMMAGGQYTTCDDHDHPHFYLKMTKAKVKPGDYIACGPAYMVVGEVPLPLAIPFGFFPISKSYSSGIIMPNFGDDYSRGLNLSGGGYYFAINDYMDLQILGDIYTRGTWAIRAQSKYIWRYHFTGNVNISYRNDVTGEKGLPDYATSKNFQVQWTHSQDPKFNPYCTFSASVNFATSGYNRSNINSYYNSALYSENTKSSTISYTQRFPDSQWSLSATASLTQRTKDSTLSLTAPELAVNMSRISPFKEIRQKVIAKKGGVMGKERWYEKIQMSYSMNGRIATSNMKEKDFATSNFLRDWQTGMQHSIPISASFMLFKYLSVTPSINLKDRMYFQRIDRSWDDTNQELHMDTTNGFYNVFDFNVGLSLSTKIYGFYTPLKKLFPKSRVEKFRHVISPSLSISYHPDFEKKFWGYYGSYDEPVYSGVDTITGRKIQKTDESGNPVYQHQTYSRFSNGIYGNAPSGGMSATLNFGLANNLEMKIVNREDTTGKNPYKVVSLIDNFEVTGGYNFAADSMRWSKFDVNLRLKFPKLNNYSVNLNTHLDPYMYELNALGYPVRTDKQYWHHGRFPHWDGLSWTFNYTISNNTIKKWKEKAAARREGRIAKSEEANGEGDLSAVEKNEDGTDKNAKQKKKGTEEVEDGYIKTDFPWSISINYSLRYGDSNEFDYDKMYYKMKFTHSLILSGNLGLGKGWKVSANMTYNFEHKQVTACTFNVSRDLHCWNMSASINPIGPFKSYTFHIGVNASILSDLKYDKNSNQSTNSRVEWW